MSHDATHYHLLELGTPIWNVAAGKHVPPIVNRLCGGLAVRKTAHDLRRSRRAPWEPDVAPQPVRAKADDTPPRDTGLVVCVPSDPRIAARNARQLRFQGPTPLNSGFRDRPLWTEPSFSDFGPVTLWLGKRDAGAVGFGGFARERADGGKEEWGDEFRGLFIQR